LQPHEWKIPFWCHFCSPSISARLDARVLFSPLPSSFRHQIPVQCDAWVLVSTAAPRVQLKEIGPNVQLQEWRLFCLFIYSQIYIHMFSCTTVIFFFLPFDFNHKCDERASCMRRLCDSCDLKPWQVAEKQSLTLTFVFMWWFSQSYIVSVCKYYSYSASLSLNFTQTARHGGSPVIPYKILHLDLLRFFFPSLSSECEDIIGSYNITTYAKSTS
jgi:hypothetical protein